MNPTWPANPRYVIGAMASWALFLACVVGVVFGRTSGWPPAALMALAAVPAATVAWQFWAAYRLIAAQDEFFRALTVKRMVVAAGLSITLATAWSVMELTGLPHLPAWLIYPLFWGLFGLVTPVIRDSRA
ncbi:hypothetical protein ASD21_20155 [Caulobacter sp. Root1455]|uniref:hypothetical protein n=2 Tax=unclassified Caulobacter TaxID=2648921 RepID=UPI000700E4B4|nr:hypothetical protein [Caulobacter sp. Root1455]KQY34686.1 hypothetical protein ASD38_21245 [Caulobacter sp. Root487D2Y]KQZ03600.1 hypothetical protein ASD21_20155 [Caulobacter sp. Root1455]